MLHIELMSAWGSAHGYHSQTHRSCGKRTWEARIVLLLTFFCRKSTSVHISLARKSHMASLASKEARKYSPFLNQEGGEVEIFVEQQKWLSQTPSLQNSTQESGKPPREGKLASRRRKADCGTPPPELNSLQLLSCANLLFLSFSFSQLFILLPRLFPRVQSTFQLGVGKREGIWLMSTWVSPTAGWRVWTPQVSSSPLTSWRLKPQTLNYLSV